MRSVVLGLKNGFRGQQLIEDLRKVDLEPELINALDGRGIPEFLKQAIYDPFPQKFLNLPDLSLPEIACSASHLHLYRWAHSLKIAWLLILEDDVTLLKNPKELIESISTITYPAIISMQQPYRPSSNKVLNTREIIIRRKANQLDLLQEILEPRLQTCSYLINLAALKKLSQLQSSTKVLFRADWPLHLYPQTRFYVTKEPYFLHPSDRSNSTIVASRVSRHQIARKGASPRAFNLLGRLLGIKSLVLKFRKVPFRSSYYFLVILPIRKFFTAQRY